MSECWRPVVGFEGRYEVSDLGRVRSVDRQQMCAGNDRRRPHVRRYKGKFLRPGPMASGHLSVAIGKGNSRQVHQLVLEAFVGPCPEGHEVLHLNHEPSDNRLTNLKYGTRSENVKMDYAAGTRTYNKALAGSRWRKARAADVF